MNLQCCNGEWRHATAKKYNRDTTNEKKTSKTIQLSQEDRISRATNLRAETSRVKWRGEGGNGKKKEIHQRGGNEACPILKSHIRKQRYSDCWKRDGDELWWSCGWWREREKEREKRNRWARQQVDGITLPLLKSLPRPLHFLLLYYLHLFLPLSPPPSFFLSLCLVKRDLALNGNRGSGDHAGLLQQGPFLSSLSPQQSSTYLPGI